MITFETAYEITMAAARFTGTERVPMADALDRVLAEDVLSDVNSPPFNRAAVDGYACRRADLPGDLTVIESIRAGAWPQKTVGPGECARIMTGAPVPAGADTVFMIEQSAETAGRVRFTGENTSSNICPTGEDVAVGDKVLSKWQKITPACIAVLASAGCVQPLVARQPRVAVLATGDELVDAAQKPGPATIRNSNGPQLIAQLRSMGLHAADCGIVGDQPDAIEAAVKRARRESDVLLVSGGSSVGDYDFVPAVLGRQGFGVKYERVAMQPGRPTLFGDDGRVYCFGIPGNPAATFVVFEILVKPFLFRLMGHAHRPVWTTAVLDEDIRRRKVSRPSTVPIAFPSPGHAVPLDFHGSAHIQAMSAAQGLFTIPAGTAEIPKGTTIHVRSL